MSGLRAAVSGALALCLVGMPAAVPAGPSVEDSAGTGTASRWGDPAATVLIERGLTAVRTKAFKRAQSASAELKAAYPGEPARLVIDFTIAVGEYNANLAAALFTRMVAETPKRLAAPVPLLDASTVGTLIAMVSGDTALQVSRALVAAQPAGVAMSFNLINARRTVIDAEIAAGNIAAATAVATQVADTFSVRDFMILDRYRALQLVLLARWGPDLAGVADSERSLWQRSAAVPGRPLTALTEKARWQILDGDPNGAVASMLPALDEAFSPATSVRDRFPFVDVMAQALAQVGRGDEGLALYERFRAVTPISEGNREDALLAEVLLLGNMGRAGEALKLGRIAEANTTLNMVTAIPWGQRLQVCAAVDSGDLASADKIMKTLLAGNGWPIFKVQALICLNRMDEAAAVAVGPLQRQADLRLLRRLQREPAPRWGVWQRRWSAGYAILRERPDVQAAIEGYGTIRSIGFGNLESI